MYFRYGLRELSHGRHPDQSDWRVTRNDPVLYRGDQPAALGPLPSVGNWPITDQQTLAEILAGASLSYIARHVSFPDWLGYLGLGLLYTEDVECDQRILTKAWGQQLIEILPPLSRSRQHLGEIQNGPHRMLGWRELEEVESDLARW